MKIMQKKILNSQKLKNHSMLKKIKQFLSALFFIIGIIFIFWPDPNTKGSIFIPRSFQHFILGGLCVIISGLLLLNTQATLDTIVLSSSLKRNRALLRLAKEAVRSETIERELNHLISELNKGNFEAGLGHPGHIAGTNVFYLRGRNGGRLYYHHVGENHYEIVAKSSKGTNQNQVI